MRGIDAGHRDLIRDVVNEGLSPYVVSALEKDLHLGFILERLRSRQPELPGLVLCGGTSLCKGHKLIAKMSEDMDFKVIVGSDCSKNQRLRLLTRLKAQTVTLLADEGFVVEIPSAHNRNSFFGIKLRYAPCFPIEVALRSHILLEFTAESLLLLPVLCATTSLLGRASREELHSISFPCLQVNETVAEKSVAFLRRSRSSGTESCKPWDLRLVRHVYDIGAIGVNGVDFPDVEAAFVNAMERDATKSAISDPQFRANPRAELAFALNNADISTSEGDYETFVTSPVAGPALRFNQAFEQFQSLVRKLLR